MDRLVGENGSRPSGRYTRAPLVAPRCQITPDESNEVLPVRQQMPATQHFQLEWDQQLALQSSKRLGRPGRRGEVSCEASHVGSPGSANRPTSAIAPQAAQALEIRMREHAKLHEEGNPPTHTGDDQVRFAAKPDLGLINRLFERPGVLMQTIVVGSRKYIPH